MTSDLISVSVAYFSPESSVIEELDKNYDKYFPAIFRYGHYAENSEHLAYLTKTYKEYYFGDKSIRENVHGFSKVSLRNPPKSGPAQPMRP